MTNGDRIRNMNDEELAAVLMCPYDTVGDPIDIMPCVKDGKQQFVGVEECRECSISWLRRESTEEIHYHAWNDVNNSLPEAGEYVLLSLSNFSLPIIGRYEVDDTGDGAFYAGDELESLVSQRFIVNAWMPLPEPYKED